jgi:hypothetical protein
MDIESPPTPHQQEAQQQHQPPPASASAAVVPSSPSSTVREKAERLLVGYITELQEAKRTPSDAHLIPALMKLCYGFVAKLKELDQGAEAAAVRRRTCSLSRALLCCFRVLICLLLVCAETGAWHCHQRREEGGQRQRRRGSQHSRPQAQGV